MTKNMKGSLMTLGKYVLISGGIIGLFAVGVLAALGYSQIGAWFASPQNQATILSADSGCNLLTEPCTAAGEGLNITLWLKGEVRPLKAFDLRVNLQGAVAGAASEVTIQFDMPDMSMGWNSFSLIRHSDGVWRGQAILPLCTLGRQDWRITVLVASNSHRYAANFFLVAAT